MMGPPGVEPGSLPCEGSVLPLDYGPNNRIVLVIKLKILRNVFQKFFDVFPVLYGIYEKFVIHKI